MQDLISAHLLRLRRKHPFFAGLSMFARYEFTDRVKDCETDSDKVYIRPEYFQRLPAEQQTGLLLHVTLHAALLHPIRRGLRNEQVWNIAADFVVNDMIAQAGDFHIPAGTAVEPKYRDLSVEQVYERLMALPRKHPQMLAMVSQAAGQSPGGESSQNQSGTNTGQSCAKPGSRGQDAKAPEKNAASKPASISGGKKTQELVRQALALRYPTNRDLRDPRGKTDRSEQEAKAEAERISNHWRSAIRKATASARLAAGRGHVPDGVVREIEEVLTHKLDWRVQLWRFLVRTPTDFSGYDRRFIHQGLYLDDLHAESLKIYMAIDTSGSVDDEQLAEFLGEVRGVKRAYHNIDVDLYFVDADVAGPFHVNDVTEIPVPIGGGGTDFRPFFQDVAKRSLPSEQALIVYLTDGDGDFPDKAPAQETLWVVTEGGIETFPFGHVTRLADQYAA